MDTQVIIMPNQAQLAREAKERHEALPWKTAPDFYPKCCGVLPEIRQGGALLTSLRCPVCGAKVGAWSLSDEFIIELWVRNRRYFAGIFQDYGPFGPMDKTWSLQVDFGSYARTWGRDNLPSRNELYGLELLKISRNKIAVGYPNREKFVINKDKRFNSYPPEFTVEWYLREEKNLVPHYPSAELGTVMLYAETPLQVSRASTLLAYLQNSLREKKDALQDS